MVFLIQFSLHHYKPKLIILNSYEYFKLIESIPQLNPVKSFIKEIFILLFILLDTLQGRFEVMNLLTGNIIPCRKVTPISITQEVIDIFEYLANKYGIK